MAKSITDFGGIEPHLYAFGGAKLDSAPPSLTAKLRCGESTSEV